MHDELREVGRGQLLVERQVEPWRSGADIGDVVVDAGMAALLLLVGLAFSYRYSLS